MEGIDIQAIVRQAVQEFTNTEKERSEPAYKAELVEERKRREQLERRMNELVAENQRSHKMAEEAERSSAVRAGICSDWGSPRSTWRSRRCRTGLCAPRMGAWWPGETAARCGEGLPDELREREP